VLSNRVIQPTPGLLGIERHITIGDSDRLIAPRSGQSRDTRIGQTFKLSLETTRHSFLPAELIFTPLAPESLSCSTLRHNEMPRYDLPPSNLLPTHLATTTLLNSGAHAPRLPRSLLHRAWIRARNEHRSRSGFRARLSQSVNTTIEVDHKSSSYPSHALAPSRRRNLETHWRRWHF
jgi:hypothetical protein